MKKGTNINITLNITLIIVTLVLSTQCDLVNRILGINNSNTKSDNSISQELDIFNNPSDENIKSNTSSKDKKPETNTSSSSVKNQVSNLDEQFNIALNKFDEFDLRISENKEEIQGLKAKITKQKIKNNNINYSYKSSIKNTKNNKNIIFQKGKYRVQLGVFAVKQNAYKLKNRINKSENIKVEIIRLSTDTKHKQIINNQPYDIDGDIVEYIRSNNNKSFKSSSSTLKESSIKMKHDLFIVRTKSKYSRDTANNIIYIFRKYKVKSIKTN